MISKNENYTFEIIFPEFMVTVPNFIFQKSFIIFYNSVSRAHHHKLLIQQLQKSLKLQNFRIHPIKVWKLRSLLHTIPEKWF